MKIVFTAIDRDAKGDAHGFEHIYTADGDGGNVKRLTGKRDKDGKLVDDGFNYGWPTWAMNGTKIVFSRREGIPDREDIREDILMMDPDGSHILPLTDNHWRNGQPKVSPDGRSLIFSSWWEEFPKVAIYRLDLATLEVENLSAQTFTDGALDGDPRWSVDGTQIVFASSRRAKGEEPTQNYIMASDGTARRRITSEEDRFFNTDPALSPDGRRVAIASYRGPGHPRPPGDPNPFAVSLWDWRLVVRDLHARDSDKGKELTQGLQCAKRDRGESCTRREGPAWVPVWHPDGKSIGYLSILDAGGLDEEGHVMGPRMCICVIDADGANGRILLSTDRAITWWDWAEAGPAPKDAVDRIGKSVSKARLLYGGRVYGELKVGVPLPDPRLFAGSQDRWTSSEIVPLRSSEAVAQPQRLVPQLARWSPDGQHIVFTARTHYDAGRPLPEPPAPAGQVRRTHFTMDDFSLQWDPPLPPLPEIAEEQVYLMNEAHDVLPVSTPWTEDYLDAIPDGEARGNTDPDVSPDGRYVVFTNVSTMTLESFILRRDLKTGEVINLTNVTAGPVKVADAKPRFSPDGAKIAFVSNVDTTSQVFLMDKDGQNVRQLTDDDYFNTDPAWSPDGRWLVYGSYRGEGGPVDVLQEDEFGHVLKSRPKARGWVLIKLEVRTGAQKQLTSGADSAAFRPVWAPDGQRIGYIHVIVGGQPDIYVVDPEGVRTRPLAVTLLTKEEFFDWR